jgi:predicted nucleotidyltransferase
MDSIIPLRVNTTLVSELDALVGQGIFPNRNEGIRSSLRSLISYYTKKSTALPHRFVAQILANFIISHYQQYIQKVILFGSVAKGTHNFESDLDILCLSSRKLSFSEELEITRECLNLIDGIEVVPSLQFYEQKVFDARIKKGNEFEREILQTGITLREVPSNI